jgi:hypothetical protein
MSGNANAAVVFVDHTRWGIFSQFAAYLRRCGIRTIRVTLGRDTWYHRIIDRLLYDRVIHTDEAGLANVAAMLDDENVVDVQCTEYVCAPFAAGDLDLLGANVAQAVRARSALLDKFMVGELATARGVRTPQKLDASTTTPAEAIALLGLPIVLKARVGACGDRVRIANTTTELEDALAGLGLDRSELFFERCIDGECVDYSAVIGADGPVLEVVARGAVAMASTTPRSSIEIIDEPQLLAFGRHAVEKLGVTGNVNMDTIKDRDGNYWLLDVNLRAWGSMFSCLAAGLDFGASYRYASGLSSTPPPRTGRLGMLTVFPGVVDDGVRDARVVATLAALVRHSPRWVRQLGFGYWCAQVIASAVGLAGSLQTVRARRL